MTKVTLIVDYENNSPKFNFASFVLDENKIFFGGNLISVSISTPQEEISRIIKKYIPGINEIISEDYHFQAVECLREIISYYDIVEESLCNS